LSGKQILSFETVHLAACSAPRVIAAILRLAAFVRCMQHAAFSFPYAFSHTTDLSLRPLSSFQILFQSGTVLVIKKILP
jgi:hypothetical protein